MTPFYFHYCKEDNCMVVHYNGCTKHVKNIQCLVPTSTKWNDKHPTLVMEGEAKEVVVIGTRALIIGN